MTPSLSPRLLGALMLVLVVASTGCRPVSDSSAPPQVSVPDTAPAEQSQATSSPAASSPEATSSQAASSQAASPEATSPQANSPTTQPEPAPPEPTEIFEGTPLAPGNHTISLRQGLRNRSYIVHVPARTSGHLPVVLAMHGGGGTGADFQDQNGLDAVADREGFLAVYPEGTGVLPNRLHTWNSGDSCCGFALDRDIDDVAFLRMVLNDLAERVPVDSTRVYATGHSNGGMMAYRFAVEASDVVTAIAPVGGALDLNVTGVEHPVSMLHIHSLDDPRALYEGGIGPPFPGTDRGVNHEPVMAGVERWATLHGCAPAPKRIEGPVGSGLNAGHTMETLQWSDCINGTRVEHLILTGTGHGWPGVTVGPIVQDLLGPSTTLINASEEIWAFLAPLSR